MKKGLIVLVAISWIMALPVAYAASNSPESDASSKFPSYFEIEGGAMFPNSSDSTFRSADGSGAQYSGKIKYDRGWTGGLAVGAVFPHDIRVEAELAYMRADIKQVDYRGVGSQSSSSTSSTGGALGNLADLLGLGAGTSSSSSTSSTPAEPNGYFSSVAFMINTYKDFTVFGIQRVKPYIGIGVGGAEDILSYNQGKGDSIEYAYQGMAGLDFQLASHAILSVGYRYFATGSPNFNINDQYQVKTGWRTSNVEMGLRITQ